MGLSHRVRDCILLYRALQEGEPFWSEQNDVSPGNVPDHVDLHFMLHCHLSRAAEQPSLP